jgi:hypothetical protein
MSLVLVIKGTIDEAKKAAQKRHVTLTSIREGRHGHSVATAGDRFAIPVNNWYRDRNNTANREGYQVGTLVLYKEKR